MAVLAAAVARGWRLAEVESAIASGTWKGLPGCMRGPQSLAGWTGSCPTSGENASPSRPGRKTYADGTLATSAHAPR